MNRGGYTMIDDLPDLDREDRQYDEQQNREEVNRKIMQRNIRPSQTLSPDSGMVAYHKEEGRQGVPQQFMMPQFMPREGANVLPKETPTDIENAENLRCIDVARHIQNCPVCQKIYHHDKSLYIIIIIILSIVCVLLLKKVLNV